MSIILRAIGDALDVDACRTWIPDELLTAIWQPGERPGRLATTYGFNMILADDEVEADAASATAVDVLSRFASELRALSEAGIRMSVDASITVARLGRSSASFSTTFLARLLEIGAGLTVSAYPIADHDDA